MPPRKGQREAKSIKIDAVAHRHLETLKDALRGQGVPRYVDNADVVSAMVLYTTPEQLAGMLAAYWRSTDDLLSAGGSAKTTPKDET